MTDIIAEIDRHDGIIECTPQNVAALVAEIQRLRMQLADHGEIITRLETKIDRLRQGEGP